VAALDESQRSFRETIAANARETEHLRMAADSIRAELLVSRKMQVEVLTTLEKERERTAAERAEQDRNLAAVDDARQQLSAALAESERTVKDLAQKLGEATRTNGHTAERQKAEMNEMRDALETAHHEAEQWRMKFSAAQDDFMRRLVALEEKITAVSADRQRVVAEAEAARAAHARELAAAAEEARRAAAAREEAAAKAEAERALHVQEIARELEEARNDITALERENAAAKAAREAIARQRDDLARRIARITDEQKRILDDLAEPEASEPGQRSVRPAVVKPHIVELSDSDLLPSQRERVINLPPARPAPIAPPKVRTI
jgi:colicin import membrane protein/SWI/SNF-related matrix-associated actin-dependent regulator 1 of chromatin subfamily A